MEMVKKIEKVWFTKDVVDVLDAFGYREPGIKQLAEEVIRKPRGKYEIDTSDNFAIIGGIVPLSFLRNWHTGEAWVMTLSEARKADDFSNGIAITEVNFPEEQQKAR